MNQLKADSTPHRFVGRTVLVTGGSGGIGSEICRRFAAEGARVIVHYGSNRQAADQLVASLHVPPESGEHRALGADLRDAEAVRDLVERAAAPNGLDILVNNAGVFERHPPMDSDFDTWCLAWDRAIGINLVASAHAAWAAAQHMKQRGRGGRIVNISSRGAFRGEPDSPAYGASKAGLNALSQSLAAALAPDGIFVYAVAPGFVETAMARPYLTGEMADAIRSQSPLGRVATAGDVAYWVLALAADGAEFATGAVIDVNGASYLRT